MHGSIFLVLIGQHNLPDGYCKDTHRRNLMIISKTALGPFKAKVTLCRSGGPDLYDLKNRRERHGGLIKSWQHRTDILEVCSVGKRSALIGKPVRQSLKHRSHCADHSLPMFPIIADRPNLWWSWHNHQIVALTHWGRYKMDAISQTIFSNAFSLIKMHEFRLRFH